MKLLINASILSDKNTGLGVYTRCVLEKVCPLLIENKIYFDIACLNPAFLPESLREYCIVISFKNYIERIKAIEKISGNYDLIWSTTQHGIKNKKVKQIVTIHDLIPIFYPKGRLHQYFYYKIILPKILNKNTHIITVSRNTKNDIIKKYHISTDKIHVISENINHQNCDNLEFYDIKEKYGIENQKYFCITGIHYNYKNIHSVIKSYYKNKDLQEIKVVIIGNDNCKYGLYLKKLVKKYKLTQYFIFTGYIDNNKKNDLLRNCLAAVYPSKYEGFGLPILEAMNIGVPVICSNTSSLPEVGGDGALYFDPNSINDIREKMIMIMNDRDLRMNLINKGYINAGRFSWSNVSLDIFELIKKLSKE